MNGATINGWIFIPPEFVITIYLSIIIAIVAVYFISKGFSSRSALPRSIIIAFFCSGFIYLIYSENTWYKWFAHDMKLFWGHSSEEKTMLFVGQFYDFITISKKYLADDNYTVYSSDYYTRLLYQYYVLPKRNRINAKYILVISDNDIYYDINAKYLLKGNNIIANTELIFIYDPRTFILRTK